MWIFQRLLKLNRGQNEAIISQPSLYFLSHAVSHLTFQIGIQEIIFDRWWSYHLLFCILLFLVIVQGSLIPQWYYSHTLLTGKPPSSPFNIPYTPSHIYAFPFSLTLFLIQKSLTASHCITLKTPKSFSKACAFTWPQLSMQLCLLHASHDFLQVPPLYAQCCCNLPHLGTHCSSA